MHRRTTSALAIALFAAVALAACASSPAQGEGDAADLQGAPLAALVGQPLIILPVRYLEAADTLGWGTHAGDASDYLRELDRAIIAELEERGVASSWTLADRLVQSARRNPTAMPDPTLVPAERMRGRLVGGSMVGEPLASQLRALTAIGGARHALLPVELRFENAEGGGARPVLRFVLIDTRTAMIRIAREISAAPQPTFSPAVLTSMAERFADLFAAP